MFAVAIELGIVSMKPQIVPRFNSLHFCSILQAVVQGKLQLTTNMSHIKINCQLLDLRQSLYCIFLISLCKKVSVLSVVPKLVVKLINNVGKAFVST